MSIFQHTNWIKTLLTLCLLGAANTLGAAAFTSSDGNFTIDLPSGWTKSRPAAGAVLSVAKGASRLDIKPVDSCSTEACLEKKIQADLASVKNKKMQVIGNTYTGEEIKRIDFSTGEPFFYISFFSPKNDFSSGYFLIGKKAYSILAKDLSYAQTDLIFSFISPTKDIDASNVRMEMDLTDSRSYDIDALPAVTEEMVDAPLPEAVPAAGKATTSSGTEKTAAPTFRIPRTLITRNMPPYIKQLGRGFDILLLILLFYVLLGPAALLLRWVVPARKETASCAPQSLYPICFSRLYGTPSLIFRAQDNQGTVLMSLYSRWDSLFLFSGMVLITCAVFVMAFTSLLENTKLLNISAFTYNTIYSAISLIIPLGFVIFTCGVLWSALVMRQFALYNNKGQKVVYVMQRGLGPLRERYFAYFAQSKELLIMERNRFYFLRHWRLMNKDQQVLAHIREESLPLALARKLLGHLWGMLRASYTVEGPQGSRGKIFNTRQAFNHFTASADNAQALPAQTLLVAALIINIRDRDKWYPWF